MATDEEEYELFYTSGNRKCFQFCYLFPQNYEFYKDDLIQLWEAAGFMLRRGDSIFQDFVQGNVIQFSRTDVLTGQPRYKLDQVAVTFLQDHHDNEYFKIDDDKAYISKETLHCSLQYSIDPVTLMKLHHAMSLRTLLLIHECGTHLDEVPRDLFLDLPLLTILDFSHTNVSELPSSIGNLKHLRYLNLSGTPITTLPNSLCRLHQMQTLKLKGCFKLGGLPKGIRKLRGLVHLDVDVACLLLSMPPGLGDLTELQTLPAFIVGNDNGCHITELKNLRNLCGTLRILRLENVSVLNDVKEAALDIKSHLKKLELQWTELQDGHEFLEYLQPPYELEELQITGYGGAKFPWWIGDPLFDALTTITIHDCRKCELLPPFGRLINLKFLCISDMHALKRIDHQFCGRDKDEGHLNLRRLVLKMVNRHSLRYSTMFKAFQRLEKLTLNGMPMLEKWRGMEEGDFPCLEKLNISGCSKLTNLPELSFLISLQQLKITHCPLLESLPNKGLPTSLIDLVILDCPLLKKSYHKSEGQGWGKLAHVRNLWIDYQHISQKENQTPTTIRVDYQVAAGTSKLSASGSERKQTTDLRVFTLAELKKATRNFRTDTCLGEGSFGKVFKGWIDEDLPSKSGSGYVVAVRKLNIESIGTREWLSGMNFLRRLSHPNLVRILGYCHEGKEALLVYEFMQKGSLEYHLFKRWAGFPFSWTLRINIVLGAARGLAFLHSLENQVIYRNFNSSKIMLDENYNAKLSDISFANYGLVGDALHVTTRALGKYGYVAPEYVATGRLYSKSDVYGFGVVLLETLTGQRVIDRNRPTGHHNLVDWLKPSLSNRRKVMQVIDPLLEGQLPSKGAIQAAELSLNCLASDPEVRPSMEEVVECLEHIQAINSRFKGSGDSTSLSKGGVLPEEIEPVWRKEEVEEVFSGQEDEEDFHFEAR